MSNKNTPYFKGALWIGLLVLIPSANFLYTALTADAAELDGPNWVGVAFMLMFVNAGIMVVLLDSMFSPLHETVWFSYLHASILLSIPLIFTILLNWIAFGPGEREFSGGVSIPFFSISFGRADEIMGRIIFAIPALILDVIVVVSIVAVVKSLFDKEEKLATDE